MLKHFERRGTEKVFLLFLFFEVRLKYLEGRGLGGEVLVRGFGGEYFNNIFHLKMEGYCWSVWTVGLILEFK